MDPETILNFGEEDGGLNEGVNTFDGPSHEKLLDADFFNRFDDDFDETVGG